MPSSDPPAGSAPSAPLHSTAHIWWSRRAMWLHAVLLVVVPVFAALFWWQVQRVREGNTLSWAYVFEWPFFTGYAVYLWWKLVHDQLDDIPPGGPSASGPPGHRPADSGTATATSIAPGAEPDSEEDEELAAYNRYLAELNASGRRKRW